MSALPITITSTLCKLIPLLGSDKSGEIVATVSAIGRVLSANRLDWHDLASALCPPLVEDWQETLAYCAARNRCLRQRDREFIDSLSRWYGQPTPKQMAYLDGIARRLRGAR
jgi:hypothetical protein